MPQDKNFNPDKLRPSGLGRAAYRESGIGKIGTEDLLEHPDYPGKLIRTASDTSPERLAIDVAVTARQLSVLSHDYGVPHSGFEPYAGRTRRGEAIAYVITDRVEGLVGMEELIGAGNLPPDVLAHADTVAAGMANFMRDTAREGGFFSLELLDLQQCGYTPDRPDGQRVVLVDVQPLYAHYVAPVDQPQTPFALSEVLEVAGHLSGSVAAMQRQAGEKPLLSTVAVTELIQTVPDATPLIASYKRRLLAALERRDAEAIIELFSADNDEYWQLKDAPRQDVYDIYARQSRYPEG